MKYRSALLIVLLVILADQFLKVYVKTHFYYNNEHVIFANWFRIHFLENDGMAFGMKLSQAATGKVILTLFRLVAVIFGFFLLKTLVNKYKTGLIICGSLILAGALGNLIDSLFYGLIFTESTFHVAQLVPVGKGYGQFLQGRVVDMLYFPLFSLRLPEAIPFIGGKYFEFFEPVFNIADASISVGVIVLILFQKRLTQKKSHAHPHEITPFFHHEPLTGHSAHEHTGHENAIVKG